MRKGFKDVYRDIMDEAPAITVINRYEFLRGMLTPLISEEARERGVSFLSNFKVYELTSDTAIYCADIYSKLRAKGRLINEMGVLIAGICAENGVGIITNDSDFIEIGQITSVNVRIIDS